MRDLVILDDEVREGHVVLLLQLLLGRCFVFKQRVSLLVHRDLLRSLDCLGALVFIVAAGELKLGIGV